MRNVLKICINPDNTLLEALENLENEESQIVLIIDENKKLLGTVSDGDIRRNLIKGNTLSTKVSKVMNKKFISVKKGNYKQNILDLMRKKDINQISILKKMNNDLHIERLKISADK